MDTKNIQVSFRAIFGITNSGPDTTPPGVFKYTSGLISRHDTNSSTSLSSTEQHQASIEIAAKYGFSTISSVQATAKYQYTDTEAKKYDSGVLDSTQMNETKEMTINIPSLKAGEGFYVYSPVIPGDDFEISFANFIEGNRPIDPNTRVDIAISGILLFDYANKKFAIQSKKNTNIVLTPTALDDISFYITIKNKWLHYAAGGDFDIYTQIKLLLGPMLVPGQRNSSALQLINKDDNTIWKLIKSPNYNDNYFIYNVGGHSYLVWDDTRVFFKAVLHPEASFSQSNANALWTIIPDRVTLGLYTIKHMNTHKLLALNDNENEAAFVGHIADVILVDSPNDATVWKFVDQEG